MSDFVRARLPALLLIVALALLASACGDDDEDASTDAAPAAGAAAGVVVDGDPGSKPEITLPADEPPAELTVVDLIEGEGDEVSEGATVTTDYVGVSWLNDGQEFDSSWDRGEAATFPLSGVIPGWTEGIPGMREGGRRLLIIPPELAYGAQPPTPAIAENDTLVFVIDLVSAE